MQKTWKWAFLAAATAGAALLAAEPLLAVTAVVQPHSSVAAQASDNLIEQVRRGGGRMGGFRGGSRSFREGASAEVAPCIGDGAPSVIVAGLRTTVGRRATVGRGCLAPRSLEPRRRRWRGRGWGHRRVWGPGFHGGYRGGYWGRRCPIGYRWTYNWGCVPLYALLKFTSD